MTTRHETVSPKTVALARQRYAEGAPVSGILAETGMSHGTLYFWLDGGPNDGSGPRLPVIPRRRLVMRKRRPRLPGQRISIVERLWRTAERQVRDIEDRLRLSQQEPAERERDARVMAVLVKTVRELSLIEEKNRESAPEDDDGARDLEDFRRELARKIDGLIAARSAGAGDGADPR